MPNVTPSDLRAACDAVERRFRNYSTDMRYEAATVLLRAALPAMRALANLERWTDDGLECPACDWRGVESQAREIEDIEDPYFVCPDCSEVCAHVPINELIDDHCYTLTLAHTAPFIEAAKALDGAA